MTKAVSKQQVFKINSKVLDLNMIDIFVNKVFLDKGTLARTYVHYQQIFCAMYLYEGGNEFQTKQNNLHFGVRKTVTFFFQHEFDKQALGIVVMVEEPNVNFLNSLLTYGPPDISRLDLTVFLLVDELLVMINVIGENSKSVLVYLEALWRKEGINT